MKIEVLEVKEKEDGTSEVIFDYDDEYYEFMKSQIGKEEPSEEEITEFLSNMLQKAILESQEESE